MNFSETNFFQDVDGKWWVDSTFTEVVTLGPFDTLEKAKEKDLEYWNDPLN